MMQSLEEIEASMRAQQAASGGPQFKSLEEIEASLVSGGEYQRWSAKTATPNQ